MLVRFLDIYISHGLLPLSLHIIYLAWPWSLPIATSLELFISLPRTLLVHQLFPALLHTYINHRYPISHFPNHIHTGPRIPHPHHQTFKSPISALFYPGIPTSHSWICQGSPNSTLILELLCTNINSDLQEAICVIARSSRIYCKI